MSVPVEQRPAGWDHPMRRDSAAAWDLPHATIGYGKDGQPYKFPICDLCGHCCGHVQPGILSCEACRDRRELIRETLAELKAGEAKLRCTTCGRTVPAEHWRQLGINGDTGEVGTECPYCNGEAEIW